MHRRNTYANDTRTYLRTDNIRASHVTSRNTDIPHRQTQVQQDSRREAVAYPRTP